ncbi:MAG: leucine-rich repeat protein [Oscillospiraceae bacterium]|nr:leucine-rich repeat protein [Oscillospiraceae bacterium]
MKRNRKMLALVCAAALFLSAGLPDAATAADNDFVIERGTLTAYNGSSGHVVIPDSVYHIGDDVFRGKTFITSVTMPKDLVTIGRRAFQGCTGLTSVTIPQRTREILTDAFFGCTSLTAVNFNLYLEVIYSRAFKDCPITSVKLPYGLKTVGFEAFRGSRITTLDLPSTVEWIEDFAFHSAGSLPTIRYVSGHTDGKEYVDHFKHPFEVIAEWGSKPPVLPEIDIPLQKIRNAADDIPAYIGQGTAPQSWAIKAVNFMIQNTGIAPEYFKAYSDKVTRTEAAYFLVNIYYSLMNQPIPDDVAGGSSEFADCDDPYVIRARTLRLIGGTGVNAEGVRIFSPDDLVTREQMAAMFMGMLGTCNIKFASTKAPAIRFADHAQISAGMDVHLQNAYNLGLMNGTSTNPVNISPKRDISREEVFVMMLNLFTKRGDIEHGYERAEVKTPVLMWSEVGKYSDKGIDEAYYSAPAVADIDKDGKPEVITTSYSIYCINAETGAVKWQVPSGFDRKNGTGKKARGSSVSDVIVMDIDGDGELEIVTGHSLLYDENGSRMWGQDGGIVAVYDKDGNFKPGWPVYTKNRVASVVAADMTGDGKANIIVGTADANGNPLFVYTHDGKLMPGWPQPSDDKNARKQGFTSKTPNSGYMDRFTNNTLSVGNLGGKNVIIAPNDNSYLGALDIFGSFIMASPLFPDLFGNQKSWGRVGAFEDYQAELRGDNDGYGFGNIRYQGSTPYYLPWEEVPLADRFYVTFQHSRAVVTDVDGDGNNEVVIIGTVKDKAIPRPEPPRYETPFIFNADRTRFQTAQYDWTSVPKDTGAYLTEDMNIIDKNQPTPVIIDVNNDGTKDIVFNSGAGKVMCYSLEQELLWSYWVCDEYTAEYASEVTVTDLNGDGFMEIIFTTFTQKWEKGGRKNGSLVILNHNGSTLQKIALPPSVTPNTNNGSLARPVVSKINGENWVFINTQYGGVCAYRIPN